MTNHSVVKRGVRVNAKERWAADCDVPDREMTQWSKVRGGEITETERNREEKTWRWKSENKKVPRWDGKMEPERDRQADWQRGLPGWRVASLSSDPPQREWVTRALAPTLPPPRPAACKGNTGRARVKGRVRDRAEQKPQPQNQGGT